MIDLFSYNKLEAAAAEEFVDPSMATLITLSPLKKDFNSRMNIFAKSPTSAEAKVRLRECKIKMKFMEAVKNNDLEEVRRYVEKEKVPITSYDRGRQTAVHIAIQNNYLTVLEYLMLRNVGALVGAEDKHKRTPLHLAAALGRLNITQYLVEELHFPVNAVNTEDISVVHMASAEGQLKTVKYLVQKGADVFLANMWEDIPLHVAARRNQIKIVDFLLADCKVPLNQRNVIGDTVLHQAVKSNRLKVVQYLIEQWNASPLDENFKGQNSLYMAMYLELEEVVDYMIEKCNLFIFVDTMRQLVNTTKPKPLTDKKAQKAKKKAKKKEEKRKEERKREEKRKKEKKKEEKKNKQKSEEKVEKLTEKENYVEVDYGYGDFEKRLEAMQVTIGNRTMSDAFVNHLNGMHELMMNETIGGRRRE